MLLRAAFVVSWRAAADKQSDVIGANARRRRPQHSQDQGG